MFLVSIDPHVKNCTLAVFDSNRAPLAIKEVKTAELIFRPHALHDDFYFHPKKDDKFLVIERPWVGKNPKGSITLAITVGKIMGVLGYLGFQVEEAPAWGTNGSWIYDMLSCRNRMPTRAQVAKLSMQIVKAEYPEYAMDEHGAAAVCMGLWFLKKRKMAGL